ncbi:MAG: PilC/PilY family type IV pilus protein [Gammaproteobacteria bacterium]|nr:PilC/PilY family type IV pilus protein [Gammaproteobacteria bacterium]
MIRLVTVPDCNDAPGDGNCDVGDAARSHIFTVGAGSADQLENPLFYAAKWGGFIDQNGNGIPDLDEEWDSKLEDGSKCTPGVNCDGIPDNYFFVSNPANLEDALRRVFDAILERVSSGTAASVVANEQEGTGAIFQALYDPVRTDNDENEAEWIGTLQSLFIDPDGRLREDSNGNAKLDGYQTDKVVEIFFDAGETQTKLRRFTSASDDDFDPTGSVDLPLDELDTLWNAREQLSTVTDATTQRNYTSTADNGRYITTWLDSNHNGVVDSGEQVAFAAGTFDNSNYGWLDQSHDDGTTTVAENLTITRDLVNYIRGEEIGTIGAGTAKEQDTRNRTLDYNGDGTTEVMRLGDIVNSTPTPVQAPFEAFDLLAGDASYAEFRQQYATRRQVVYVGGNDGMIHAFNAGFFDANTLEFKTNLTTEPAHPLGAELWAYAPKNLLPHLQWLAREDYEHVYYADLKPRVFDAKIFPDDSTHPNGWGTVLVVGFRLGGGTDTSGITVDSAGDGLGGANSSDDVETKSAFVVMDVTDPEQPPEVIAELTPPDLNFTTSFPAVVLVGDPDATGADGTPNKWYLVFGSGPTNLGTVSSAQRARLFGYDLEAMVDGDADNGRLTTGPFANDLGAEAANSFVGDPITADFDFDMQAEVMYFGTVGDTDSDEGKLFRLPVNEKTSPGDWGPAHVFLDANQPFSAQPSVALDDNGNPWVIAGTGRFYANGDKPSTATQTLYGIKDPNDLEGANTTISVSIASLFNVTDTRVFADGNVDSDGDGDADMTYEELQQCTTGQTACNGTIHQGWRRDYEADGSNPAQRSVNRSSVLGGVVLNTAFTPSTSQCGLEGSSILLGLGFDTGASVGAFGAEPCPTCPNEADFLPPSVDLGFGLASSPSIHIGKPGQEDVPGKVTVIIQKSTGEISGQETNVDSGIQSGEVSWREFINE